jgi:hypothetical protein
MKLCLTAVGTLAVATLSAAVPAHRATADTGTVVGVGAYLVGDYVVGRKCGRQVWPLNIVNGVVRTVQGKTFCTTYRYRRSRR